MRTKESRTTFEETFGKLVECDVWGFHGDASSCCCLLYCDAVYRCDRTATFRRTTLPPSSGWSNWELEVDMV